MNRYLVPCLFTLTLIASLSCGGDDPVNPTEESLNPNDYLMVVGSRKYMVLLNADYAGLEWNSFVCALTPNPVKEGAGMIDSDPFQLENLDLLQATGVVGNVIYDLEPDSKYYCRTYNAGVDGIQYGPNLVFNTGPDIGPRLTSHTRTDTNGEFTYEQLYFYDTLGGIKFSINLANGPDDPRFGSESYAYAHVYDYQPERVDQYTGELRPGAGWDIEYPADYGNRRQYLFENGQLVANNLLSGNRGTRYTYEGNRVIAVDSESAVPDSVITDYFLAEAYSLKTRYILENGEYRHASTTRYEYDLSKRDPFYDSFNRQQGYAQFPLVVRYEITYANGETQTHLYDYQYNGTFPASEGSSRYYYTAFD